MVNYSFIANAHPAYIESLYERYLQNPDLVEEDWRVFFKGFEFGLADRTPDTAPVHGAINPKEFRVLAMINAYRFRGHLESDTNPIRKRRDRKAKLAISDFSLGEEDLDTIFYAAKECGMENPATLREIIAHLRRVYCSHIGFEFNYMQGREKRRWLRSRIEAHRPELHYEIPIEKKRRILEKLNGAVVFEKFLHTKFIGQKRFSLEGGESAIVGLDAIINKAGEAGIREVFIGMAHRGRLNVLANIMGKTYEQIFTEFEGAVIPDQSFGDGDVKYHLGYSSQMITPSGNMVQLELVPNPSHLEAVNPVVEGFARSKADVLYNSDYDRLLPVLIHGDAALAGQGVVYETIQMSKLEGYATGGTLHLVINNQIGFTTDFDDARSSTYCTGVASVVDAPVFHVNGDDPEALVFAVELALEYRQTFNEDVFIDMLCYRRHGHNEGDDPKFTQPDMYDIIVKHPNPREIYTKELIESGVMEKQLADEMEARFWKTLQERLDNLRQHTLPYVLQAPEAAWKSLLKPGSADFDQSPPTGIPTKTLDVITGHLLQLPDDFTPLPKAKRLLEDKQKMLANNQLDWAMGELMAYASILLEGKDVRMSGQDVKRGTFSHRHAVMYDAKTGRQLNRLSNIRENQGKFRIFNSLLSEFGVMGFEYGYSLGTPHSLVLWEAQFGDFHNGAQTMVDQFITAAESKWQRMSGLVLLLPHGYEGQGPEHSSARMERFLQSCADLNMVVANVTTPANFFHLLRRQLAWNFRKPLVVMSPKSLLRHPECVSPLEAMATGKRFQEVIPDPDLEKSKSPKVTRMVLCSGKVYYDLQQKKREMDVRDVAIVRVEQVYPFPAKQLDNLVSKYGNPELVWVQEEPANMGAWSFVALNYRPGQVRLISRKAGASPATGFKKVHDQQQESIIGQALNVLKEETVTQS
jgi:2-oxoglutarate dehydrogenase E1 component